MRGSTSSYWSSLFHMTYDSQPNADRVTTSQSWLAVQSITRSWSVTWLCRWLVWSGGDCRRGNTARGHTVAWGSSARADKSSSPPHCVASTTGNRLRDPTRFVAILNRLSTACGIPHSSVACPGIFPVTNDSIFARETALYITWQVLRLCVGPASLFCGSLYCLCKGSNCAGSMCTTSVQRGCQSACGMLPRQ